MPIALRLRFGQRQDLFRWAWLPCLLSCLDQIEKTAGHCLEVV